MVQGFMKWEKESKIILGLDIGTTQSAVSYALLFKGDEASVKRVSKWPEQAKHQEGSKVPTQIYYDDDGKAVKCGAETTTNDAETLAEDEKWRLAKYFKLHVHPPTMRAQNNMKVEPLPDGVSLRQIYVDFMKYLLKNTKNYIRLYEPDGDHTWTKYSPSMDIVIAHPNGWGIKEQGFLREVAVEAEYCSSKGAATQIHFVSEAEASVHFCITYAGFDRVLKPGIEFIVCDAGGSTVDTTAYSVIADEPSLSIEERKVSSCVQAGGIFVDDGARSYLSQVLGKSGLDADTLDDYVKKGVEEFEATAKRQFSGSEDYISIKVGDRRFSDTEANVSRGKMKLQGEIMKGFYQAPVNEILKAVENQLSGLSAEHILLVGGFGESRYLRTCIEGRFKAKKIVHADDGKSKAVADGAVIWIAKGAVSKRAVRFAYGIEIRDGYNETNPNHQDRHVFSDGSGSYVGGRWSRIVPKGQILEAGAFIRRTYDLTYQTSAPQLESHETDLYAYNPEDDESQQPEWLLTASGSPCPGFMRMCTVTADLSGMSGLLEKKIGKLGTYWTLNFSVGVEFGDTQLKAHLEWNERGKPRRGPATIVPMNLDEGHKPPMMS